MRWLLLFCFPAIFICAAGAHLEASPERNARDEFKRTDWITFPESAPYSPQAAALGKMLFFDPRLSGAQNMSCATCHNPSFGWETPVPRAIGAMNTQLDRHAPTIENLAEASHFFWDGRAASLEEQAVVPLTHPLEMNADLNKIATRLSGIKAYKEYFEEAFPAAGLTPDTILRAIATYERTLRSAWAPFDDWVEGEEDAISEAAKRGFDLFTGKANCSVCHSGWTFTDHEFHDIGLATRDKGRINVVPGNNKARFAFKTPGLRNITLRAPYMHNGEIGTLRDVINHYVSGGIVRQSRDVAIESIDLSEKDIDDLIAFLKTLTATNPHVPAPVLPAG